MKIIIIGSGIAGLSASYLLGLGGHEVHILERQPILGMDAASVDVAPGIRLDTPPRSINKHYYPNLLNLYDLAGVEVEPFSWDLACGAIDNSRSTIRTKTVFGRAIPIGWSSLKECASIAKHATRLYGRTQADMADPAVQAMTFGEYLQATGPYSEAYLNECLLPALATWCTCSFEAVRQYPAVIILEFLMKHSMGANYHTKHGSADAVAKLSSLAASVKTNTTVTGVYRGSSAPAGSAATATVSSQAPEAAAKISDGTKPLGDAPAPDGCHGASGASGNCGAAVDAASTGIRPRVSYIDPSTGQEVWEECDHVIMATQAHHALQLLKDPLPDQASALSSYTHEWSEVVIHKDPALMPPDRRDWMPACFFSNTDTSQGSCTLWFEPPGCGQLFMTWNPLRAPEPSACIARYGFDRPLVTRDTGAAVQQLWAQQGAGGVWLVGAYSLFTVPLQESAATSGIRVAAALGCPASWLDPAVAAAPLAVDTTAAHVARRTLAQQQPGAAGQQQQQQQRGWIAACSAALQSMASRAAAAAGYVNSSSSSGACDPGQQPAAASGGSSNGASGSGGNGNGGVHCSLESTSSSNEKPAAGVGSKLVSSGSSNKAWGLVSRMGKWQGGSSSSSFARA